MSRLRAFDLAEGARHVLAHPLRSALTAVTCAVAIAVTVNVISLNYGLDEDIRRDIARFGRLTIDVGRSPLIRADAARAPFGEAELARIREAIAGLGATVVPLRSERAAGTGEVEVPRLLLASVTRDYPQTLSLDLVAGRWFAAEERGFSACVLDESAARSLFPALLGDPAAGGASSPAPDDRPPREAYARVLGRRVRLSGGEGREPVVVGVLEDPMTYRALFQSFDEGRSSRTLVGSLLTFRNVYVPPDAIPGPDLTTVSVVLPSEGALEAALPRLESMWPEMRPDDDPGRVAPITVFPRRTWMDAFGGATQAGAFLGNIVWILVCLVACIMITTQNLITVRERYDEIAVRRCEGARRSHLAAQVTAEGVLTSVAGGLLGLPIGYAGAAVLRRIVDFPFRFEARYALAAVAVSAALGLVSSVLPVRRVAALDPAAVLSRRSS